MGGPAAGLSRECAQPRPRSRDLAYVDFRVCGLNVFGAALVRNTEGELSISPPRYDRTAGHPAGAGFADKSLKVAVLEKAKAAFVALGGTLEATPAPKSEPEPAPRNLRVSRIELVDPD